MNLLYLEKFNNYYNRRVKYYTNVDEYISNSTSYSFNESVDFNPGDGVMTTKVANLPTVNLNPDYLLAITEDTQEIASRWFIMDSKRERNGQYTITLKRDVIADYFEQIKISPMFVKKANLPASNDLIYNNEDIAVNQIKTNEWPLKDETKKPWIVGYIGNDAVKEGEKTITYVDNETVINLGALPLHLLDPNDPSRGATLSTIDYCHVRNFFSIGGYTSNLRACQISYSPDFGPYAFAVTNPGTGGGESFVRLNVQNSPSYDEIKEAFRLSILTNEFAFMNAMDAMFKSLDEDVATVDDAEEIRQLNNSLVYSDITQKFYRLTISSTMTDYNENRVNFGPRDVEAHQVALYGVLDTSTTDICNTFPNYCVRQTEAGAGKCFQVAYKMNRTVITLTETLTGSERSVTIKPGHQKLIDAPYSMFAMEFSLPNLTLATKMVEELSKFIYDLQILPYCPAIELLTISEDSFTINPEATVYVDYSPILQGEATAGYMLWARKSSNTFNITHPISVNVSSAIDVKIANECDMYRLVSPNYNGAFEFNAAKNLGVDYFEVSYTYKPYSPYIQVNPNFKKLYGKDFNDARGLICNGDFSVATLTDQWKSYEINNKNYENIFNAQIKTMDKNNALQLTSNIASSIINAGTAGIGAGVLSGNVGVGIGAGVVSAVGGVADIAISQSVYQNNRQLQKDMFAMNLQTIKARPDTLNKISAYNINNKYFPFIEYYTCTDVEKEALRNKLKYEAMTVNAIGKIEDYIGAVEEYNFFKASPIILDNIADDYHVADAIAVELEKGVYL